MPIRASESVLPKFERRSFWIALVVLCAIGAAVAIRRMVALAGPTPIGTSDFAALDAFFAAKRNATFVHVATGLVLALGIPMQFSARVRIRHPAIHRWAGRLVVVVGLLVGLSAYPLMALPVGGWLERSATAVYGTAFIAALVIAWRAIRQRDVVRHREWMLRATGLVLGIATTRPVMGMFFATAQITGLHPSQFFGIAMWIGFTSTVLAAEAYVHSTRRPEIKPRAASFQHDGHVQADLA